MSTLKVTNIQATGETASRAVSGVAAAWFNLNAATPALRDSFNIGSITDQGTGTYDCNFTSALSNANYSAIGSASTKGSTNSYTSILTTGDEVNSYGLHSTASIRVNTYSNNASALSDPSMVQANIHGDLA